jgi:lipoprotein-anchoring transpeptidase ErfK/SrfK
VKPLWLKQLAFGMPIAVRKVSMQCWPAVVSVLAVCRHVPRFDRSVGTLAGSVSVVQRPASGVPASGAHELVELPVLDPVLLPVLDPVLLPVLDPLLLPVLDPVLLSVVDPVLPPLVDPVLPLDPLVPVRLVPPPSPLLRSGFTLPTPLPVELELEPESEARAAVAGMVSAAASSAKARGKRARSMPLRRVGVTSVAATLVFMPVASIIREPRRNLLILVILVFLLGPLVLEGCGGSSAAPPNTSGPTYVATALVPKIPIYDAPDARVRQTLANPDVYGQPLTFLVLDQQGDWVQVALPVRPNGSSGWVKLEQVTLKQDPYRLDVARSAHQLRLFRDDTLVQTYPIGVGKTETPTPGGVYYLRVLIKTTQPNGAYGPYAYGLNGFSTVLNDFAGGDGVIGLHGTDDPSSVGKDVSHGCIRLHNADITALAKILPLGTPVKILA